MSTVTKKRKISEEVVNNNGEDIEAQYKKAVIPKSLEILAKESNSRYLNLMVDELRRYKEKKQFEHSFKSVLYSNLEKMLLELLSISTKQLLDRQIILTYNWYKNKVDFYEKTAAISEWTEGKIDERKDFGRKKAGESAKNTAENNTDVNTSTSNVLCALKRTAYPVKIDLSQLKRKAIGVERKFIQKRIKEEREKISNIKEDQNLKLKNRSLIMNLDVNKLDAALSNEDYNKVKEYELNIKNLNKIIHFGSPQDNDDLKKVVYNKKNINKLFAKKIEVKPSTYPTVYSPIYPRHEIKSFYSYNRPKFSFYNYYYENELLKNKQRDLKEKRNLEEIKSGVENFGQKRGLYNGLMGKVREMRGMIREFRRNKSAENVAGDRRKCKDMKCRRSDGEKGGKVVVGEVRHIEGKRKRDGEEDGGDKIGKELTPPIISYIQTKLDKSKSNRDILDKNINSQINDSMIRNMSLSGIFKTRIQNSNFLDVSSAVGFNERLDHFNELSNVMMEFKKKREEDKSVNISSISDSKQSFIKKMSHCNSMDNLLQAKKELNTFDSQEYSKFKRYINENEGKIIGRKELKKAFLSPNTKLFYPKFFLPRCQGIGMLNNPFSVLMKGKGKKKKRRK